MNRPNPFASSGFFKPPTHYLGSTLNSEPAQRRRSLSLDDSDTEIGRTVSVVEKKELERPSYLTPDISSEQSSVPLVDSSRSPSPFTRTNKPIEIATEEEAKTAGLYVQHKLEEAERGRSAKPVMKTGGANQSWYGSLTYLVILVCWAGGCEFGLLLVNISIFKDRPSK